MINYLKLGIGVVLLLAFLGENFYIYRVGQKSIITNVVAGAETYQKQDDTKAKADVAQAEADSKTITDLQNERNALKEKLSHAPKTPVDPNCVLSNDELLSLQRASGSQANK